MPEWTKQMLDMAEVEDVEIVIREDRKSIWVNVDGICRLRIARIKNLEVKDNAKEVRAET